MSDSDKNQETCSLLAEALRENLAKWLPTQDHTHEAQKLMREAAAALSAEAKPAPDGFVLVPVEPTPEMVLAAWGTPCEDADPADPGTIEAWGRMLDAAPAAPTSEASNPAPVPLTDEQIDAIAGPGPDYFDRTAFARAIERAHGIGKGGAA